MLETLPIPLSGCEVFPENEESAETTPAKRSILKVRPSLPTDSAGIDRWMQGIFGEELSSRHTARHTATMYSEVLENAELEAALESYYACEMLEDEDPRSPKRARLSSIFFKEERSRTFDVKEEPQNVARSQSKVKAVKAGDLARPL
jgi:hypothetical protein